MEAAQSDMNAGMWPSNRGRSPSRTATDGEASGTIQAIGFPDGTEREYHTMKDAKAAGEAALEEAANG